MHNICMAKEVSFIRKVARRGKGNLAVTVPIELNDLFLDKRVKVTRLED